MKIIVCMTSSGIGDNLLCATVCADMKRKYDELIYCCHPRAREWINLFPSCAHKIVSSEEDNFLAGLVETLSPDAVFFPYNSYRLEHAERQRLPRWRYYADFCHEVNITPQLPEAVIGSEAMQWALPFAGSVVLAPWSYHQSRCMPIDLWHCLEASLHDRGHATTILDHEPDRGLAFTGDKVLGESAERVAAIVRQASLVISNDSMIGHLGGILGTKTLALCTKRIQGDKVFGQYPSVEVVQDKLILTGDWLRF